MRRLIATYFIILLLTSLSGLLQTAYAQSGTLGITPDDWIVSQIGSVSSRKKVTRLRDRLQTYFFDVDTDGNGITQSDYDLAASLIQARRRASQVALMLNNDLNGDGQVAREELEKVFMKHATRPLRSGKIKVVPTPKQIQKILKRKVDEAMAQDQNGDRIIDLKEMIAAANSRNAGRTLRSKRSKLPISFDKNGDGIIGLNEYDIAVDRVMSDLDSNDDGNISEQEASAFNLTVSRVRQKVRNFKRAEKEKQRQDALAKKCQLPRLEKNAKLVLLGVYEANAVSNLSIAGDDEAVGAVHVSIAPGSEQLYVIGSSGKSVIWHVTGATERVAHFVASSQIKTGNAMPRVAVGGLARDKVFVPPSRDCISYFYKPEGRKGKKVAARVAALVGREPDVIAGGYKAGKIVVPAGLVDSKAVFPNRKILPRNGAGKMMWQESLRHNPGGLADLNVDMIFSPHEIRPYKVLPQQAGLAQLMDEGALEQTRLSSATRYRDLGLIGKAIVGGSLHRQRYRHTTAFRITKKITLPAGLNGANSVRFILGKGVPKPDGDLGHSTLVPE